MNLFYEKSAFEKMPFKVVQTLEKGKPVLTAVPHGWERDGTLYWPKNQADKLIKIEDLYPEDNWIPISCETKKVNISNYDEAQSEISSILHRGFGVHERPRIQNVEPSTSSQSRDNELKIETSSQDPLTYDDQAPAALSAGMELILENQRVMMENQKKMMRKINDCTSKVEHLMSTRWSSNPQCFETNDLVCNQFSPVDDVQGLEDLDNDLKDPEKRNMYFKRYSIICQGKGEAVTCAYYLIDSLFTRKFMTKCSWAGGSRGVDSKVPFKIYKNVINFFHSLIHDCDKNFSLIDCHNFLKMILKNSVKRAEAKNMRASGKRTRVSKSLMSEIQMEFVRENEIGYDESNDGLDESLHSLAKKQRENSDADISEGDTDDVEKELGESDGFIRMKK